jgi:hypothetical protein
MRQSAYCMRVASHLPYGRDLCPFALTTLVMGVVLHRSVFGRYLYAVGKNEEAARYSGICTPCVTVTAYVICCGLTAVAAIYIAMYTRSISPASQAISTSSMPSRRPCSAAARCAAAKAPFWASSSARFCCRCCRTSSTCLAFRAR